MKIPTKRSSGRMKPAAVLSPVGANPYEMASKKE
jgi:hypothetical protein